MNNSETFTILSVGAPLVEVKGQGPYADLLGGVSVPDGVSTTAPVSLLNDPVRVWRVDAPANVQATVAITDTPFNLGALVQVRRCVPVRVRWWWIARWPRLAALCQRWAFWLFALWNLYTDWPACDWQNIGDGNSLSVNAQGGDLIVVTFVSP